MSSPESQPAFDGKAFVSTLSNSPGVYRMFGATDELLYVGKAGSLKKRARQSVLAVLALGLMFLLLGCGGSSNIRDTIATVTSSAIWLRTVASSAWL